MAVDKFGRMSDTKTKDTWVSLTYILIIIIFVVMVQLQFLVL